MLMRGGLAASHLHQHIYEAKINKHFVKQTRNKDIVMEQDDKIVLNVYMFCQHGSDTILSHSVLGHNWILIVYVPRIKISHIRLELQHIR
jgi:hypothetical protein